MKRKMDEKTKKRLKNVGAVTLAIALLLTGTFAWAYVSNPVTSEAYATVDPGGRLHDDFDGRDKDIYVENFGSQVICARVKLTEYMEIGKNANKDRQTELSGGTRTDVSPVVDGTKLTDKSTWTTYFKDEDKAERALLDGYFTLDTSGGKTVYMPTFNMNRDSLISDVNGRYENEAGGSFSYTGYLDGTHYKDHKNYVVGDTAEGFEIIDADTEAEGVSPVDELSDENLLRDAINAENSDDLKAKLGTLLGTNVEANDKVTTKVAGDHDEEEVVTYNKVTHEAKETEEAAAPITVQDYNAMSVDDKKAYTGWVIDGSDGWAYWSQLIAPKTATGLLITSIGDQKAETAAPWYLAIDAEAQFITMSDTFNVGENGEDEPSAEARRLLKELGLEEYQLSQDAANAVKEINAIESGKIGTAEAVVTIDGVKYIVVDKGTDSAILLQQSAVKTSKFGSSNQWSGSDIQTYLNSAETDGYLNGKTTLRELVGDGVTIKTATAHDRGTGNTYVETTDKVFLLSEADVFGTANGSATSEPNEYTNGTGKLNIDSSVLNTGSWWWLRSPRYSANVVAGVNNFGTTYYTYYSTAGGGVRPAVVVNL